MSAPANWKRGSSATLVWPTCMTDITSIHASIHTTSGDLVTSGTATHSGSGVYFCNLHIADSWDVGSHYYAKFTALYGTLADSSDATTIVTKRLYVLEEWE